MLSNEEQLRYLARVGNILASSLDIRTTFANMAELSVPDFADVCIVDLILEGFGPRNVATVCRDRKKFPLLDEMNRSYPPQFYEAHPSNKVVASGKPMFLEPVTDHTYRTMAQDARHLELMRELGCVSAMIVPIVIRGSIIGSIILLYLESGRHYRLVDIGIGEEIGRRAAYACENAKLYQDLERAKEAAEQANREKTDLLAKIAHEICPSLTSIADSSEVLIRQSLNESEREKCVNEIRRNGEVVTKLIRDIQEMSKDG